MYITIASRREPVSGRLGCGVCGGRARTGKSGAGYEVEYLVLVHRKSVWAVNEICNGVLRGLVPSRRDIARM